ncbi:uncharacterized protein BO97DRAFT_178102 [Aspergillus homomorphus CBS 101889]|uniref:Uncharacterized protein n=1 Tax=Aspergillus homomorphus (strain CBS 101889) TaxID=1450537 RepID=A0A395I6Z5_ASPHC|nr:hypothetical protein BO97DRAFT_178102 [Aspergillus homomorphus CBS 101889]RAL15970.1 hypothetical protein BO97DRAFT_178102 [Aspergillus homomorphus CBS 101889]
MQTQILEGRSTGLSSSSMDAMIIGVVIGSMVLLAVIGIFAYLCHKKRAMQRREDRQFLIDHHLSFALGYYPTLRDLEANQKEQQPGGGVTVREITSLADLPPPTQPMSRLSAHYHSPVEDLLRDPPPAYQPLPAYDPSRYHRVDTAPLGLAIPYNPALVQQDERPSSFVLSPPAPIMAQRDSFVTPRFSFQPSPTIGPMRDLNEVSSLSSSNPDTSVQTPRRPKPVLSRLVTDLR